jgi:hypothetical protein
MDIARKPVQGFDAWRDGDSLIKLLSTLKDREQGRMFVYEDELLNLIEASLIELIRWNSSIDDLVSLANAMDRGGDGIPSSVSSVLEDAILQEFAGIGSLVSEEDNTSQLEEIISNLEKLARIFDVPEKTLSAAVTKVQDRIWELESSGDSYSSPDFNTVARGTDRFDDRELKDLFMPLLEE